MAHTHLLETQRPKPKAHARRSTIGTFKHAPRSNFGASLARPPELQLHSTSDLSPPTP
ncbi:hypothetical protein FH972_010904 [Carpinus fangiana]|uniref:Uncharacterized protein n=1 Tax=Carpinus fangiana TaxID=176857 RepID=A0A660KSS6_9ROSI|nr:hypothetical protein FH972_010904 [Carpinus fangiana]